MTAPDDKYARAYVARQLTPAKTVERLRQDISSVEASLSQAERHAKQLKSTLDALNDELAAMLEVSKPRSGSR